MFFTPLILAAGSLPTLISGAPIQSFLSRRDNVTPSLTTRESANSYTIFGGNGETSDGWPALDQWKTFDEMFQENMGTMQTSCRQWGYANNSPTEIAELKQAIAEVGEQTGVDTRFIFAIVMQESNGCVRVPTTANGVTNPGLMQSHDGTGTCIKIVNGKNVGMNPCPKSRIYQMIHDGTAGTPSGDGLKQCLAQATGSGATQYYQAARIYNSGSLAASGNLGQGGATACYVSDLTNRLLGWSLGGTGCDASTIGSLTGSSGGFSTGPSPTSTSSPAPSPTETVPATPPPTETPSPTTTTSPDPSTGSSAPAASVYPYAASPCQKYYTVQSGDYCDKVAKEEGITFSQLRQWNSGLDAECSNLWLEYQYCVSA
ncbi:hypothetical protein N7474_000027 [Penicillium riverlandense]|uniref:uncharacterized protein n=1 Tax=Penicillium riverlandense TaxID=1903569 RepID=UPI0025467C11|nr:uncharacterized protein N7474_000027 [Penicillium riverlandense]KAJ5831716.1 hypothetical protein N7474_000027 [Penicillium riverlandense]